ncbi:MAG: type II toxin-antitoxin system prevent-host-death family antitoxin [Rikenellaceae bacterium]|jgi:antitoxin YefM|nr:type II toxin-antitoxin system prevent-host-death family antitoxin [Rikenellaceae bacterium]
MRTANFTDLRKNLKSYLDSVVNDSETVIINRDGDTGVVIMSLEEYNSIKETEYIMSSAETMKRIKAGAQSIADGRGTRINSAEELSEFANSL